MQPLTAQWNLPSPKVPTNEDFTYNSIRFFLVHSGCVRIGSGESDDAWVDDVSFCPLALLAECYQNWLSLLVPPWKQEILPWKEHGREVLASMGCKVFIFTGSWPSDTLFPKYYKKELMVKNCELIKWGPREPKEDDIELAMALSLDDVESRDLVDWKQGMERKRWFFEEKHQLAFSSWACKTCGFPNQGSKVSSLYLNDWRQRRLICSGCKKERPGTWKCAKGHIVSLDPAKVSDMNAKPPSAHMCRHHCEAQTRCDEETRSITIEYGDGFFFGKEEEQAWAESLRYL